MAYEVGKMALDIYSQRDSKALAQVAQLETARADLRSMQSQRVTPEARWSALEDARAVLVDGYLDISPTVLNALLRRAGIRVLVEEGAVVEVAFVAV